MEEFTVTEKIGTDSVKIVVVGVGGGGSNMVNNLVNSDFKQPILFRGAKK